MRGFAASAPPGADVSIARPSVFLDERNVIALEELVVERHEIRNSGLPRHLGALAVAIAALVPPVRLVPLDVELLDVAVVRAARAGELAELVVDGGEVVAAEGRSRVPSACTFSRTRSEAPIAPMTPLYGGTMISWPSTSLNAAATASLYAVPPWKNMTEPILRPRTTRLR